MYNFFNSYYNNFFKSSPPPDEMLSEKLVAYLPDDSIIYESKNCIDTDKCIKEFTVFEPSINLPSLDNCNKHYQVRNYGYGYNIPETKICKNNARDVLPTHRISSWQYSVDELKADADKQRERRINLYQQANLTL
jgi:hypothetical protein